MSSEDNKQDTGLVTNHNNGIDEKAQLFLVKFIFDTPREKLPELTNVPLDQVRPLSMMATFADEVKLLCDDMKKAQVVHTKNWKAHHKNRTKEEIRKESDAVVDGYFEFDSKLLSQLWQYYYYQLRRSIGSEHKMQATTLAQDQLAAQQQTQLSADELIDRIQDQ